MEKPPVSKTSGAFYIFKTSLLKKGKMSIFPVWK